MVFHESSEHGQGGTIPDTFKVSEVPPDNRIHHELSEDGDDHHELSNHLSKKKQGGRGCYIAVGGRFRTVVDCTSLFAVVFCTFIVPFDMSFSPDKGTALIGIDIGIECFFITEIFMNFFTSFLDEDGEEITENWAVARNYLKTWFLIDAVSSIPSETATQVTQALATTPDNEEEGGSGSLATLYNLRAIRIIRLTKLLRLVKIGKLIEMIELSMPALSTVLGLLRLLFMMMVVAHMNACIFYYLGSLNPGNSWMSKYLFDCCDTSVHLFTGQGYGSNGTDCFDPADMPDVGTLYANAIYWSFCTLATVGYGEVTPCNEMEQLYSSACMVCGSAMFAYIVGSISTVATTTNLQEQKLRDRMRELHEYLNIRKIPKEMSNKIRRQCMHRWRRTVFDEVHLLQDFTPKMRRQVVRHIHGDLVEQLPLFLNTQNDEEFFTDLMVQLKPGSAQAGEEISKVGEPADMYIVLDGEVEVDRGNGREVQRLHRGDAINELETLKGVYDEQAESTCRYSSTAVTFVDLFTLRRADLEEVYRAHHQTAEAFFLERMRTIAEQEAQERASAAQPPAGGAGGMVRVPSTESETVEAGGLPSFMAGGTRGGNRRRSLMTLQGKGGAPTSARVTGLLRRLRDQLQTIQGTVHSNSMRLDGVLRESGPAGRGENGNENGNGSPPPESLASRREESG